MAALHLTRSEHIIVVGSASLMATFGDLGGPGQLLDMTLDADLVPGMIRVQPVSKGSAAFPSPKGALHSSLGPSLQVNRSGP